MMEGIDTQWCLGCDSHYSTTDTEPYCSAECFLKHQQEADLPLALYKTSIPPSPQPIPVHRRHQRRPSRSPSASSFYSDSPSELDLASSSRPSPSYPYAGSSAHSYTSTSSSRAHAWVGKGADGVPAWVATVPYGWAPDDEDRHLSSSSSRRSRRSSTSTSSSITPPSRPRTRASMASMASSSLRPAVLSLSTRKLAPPRLDRSSTAAANSTTSLSLNFSTPPTPTVHSKSMATVTPYTSLPSLARSTASASMTSIVTPGSLLHAGSRPVTPPESEHGEHEPSIVVVEPQMVTLDLKEAQLEREEGQKGQKKNRGTGMLQSLASHFKAWAASNAFAESQVPQYPPARREQYLRTNSSSVQPPSSVYTAESPSQQHASQQKRLREQRECEREPRPAQETVRPSFLSRQPMAKKPSVFINDAELEYGFGGASSGVGKGLKRDKEERKKPWKGEKALAPLPVGPLAMHHRL